MGRSVIDELWSGLIGFLTSLAAGRDVHGGQDALQVPQLDGLSWVGCAPRCACCCGCRRRRCRGHHGRGGGGAGCGGGGRGGGGSDGSGGHLGGAQARGGGGGGGGSDGRGGAGMMTGEPLVRSAVWTQEQQHLNNNKKNR